MAGRREPATAREWALQIDVAVRVLTMARRFSVNGRILPPLAIAAVLLPVFSFLMRERRSFAATPDRRAQVALLILTAEPGIALLRPKPETGRDQENPGVGCFCYASRFW